MNISRETYGLRLENSGSRLVLADNSDIVGITVGLKIAELGHGWFGAERENCDHEDQGTTKITIRKES